MADVVIRAAEPDEGERLRELTVTSKAHWGYELEFVERWVADGDFSAAGLAAKGAFVAEEAGRIVGWAAAITEGVRCWLDDLWVEPTSMLRGVGTLLFEHAVERAREQGCVRLEWQSEPHAVGFYKKMGGRVLRHEESRYWGREPVMGKALD
jgi:GNAT superfamily N-acetyltransferase